MKEQAIFYHAGCPVCVAAEQQVAEAIDSGRFDVEIVHLGENKSRIGEAESVGGDVGTRSGHLWTAVSHQLRRRHRRPEIRGRNQ